jgi:hypothetical protein
MNVKTQPKISDAPKAFTYTTSSQAPNKENTNTLNSQPQPHFVSKYAQQLYMQ